MDKNQKSDENEIIVEVCQNCRLHRWCTRHDPKKYNSIYESVAQAITKEFGSNYQVIKNKNIEKPRIGAFEVTYKQKVVFSKITSGFFPTPSVVVQKLKEIIEGKENEEKKQEDNVEKTEAKKKDKNIKKKIPPKIATQHDSDFKIPKYDIICPSPTKIHRAYRNDNFSMAMGSKEGNEK